MSDTSPATQLNKKPQEEKPKHGKPFIPQSYRKPREEETLFINMSSFHLFTATLLMFASNLCTPTFADKCFTRGVVKIPPDHLFTKLKKPVVIGHRGNPRVYQENTLDGFKSLLDDNVDGFELDIYLTKDKKLVVFHDDNTTFLTGEDHIIFNMTYSEIQKLNVLDELEYKHGSKSTKTWSYDKKRKIPLLEEVLDAVKDSNLLMYLEMKPSHHPTDDMQLSRDTGVEVAKMVTKMGLERRAMLNSFDPFKTMAAKQHNKELVVGNFFSAGTYDDSVSIKNKFKSSMPGMSACSASLPSGYDYIQYLLEHGTVLKAINGSFVDMWYQLYDNSVYTNDTFDKIKDNYGPGATFGGWTIYSMQETEEEWDDAKEKIQRLIDNGGARLITDNYPKVLKQLGRPLKNAGYIKSATGISTLFAAIVLAVINM